MDEGRGARTLEDGTDAVQVRRRAEVFWLYCSLWRTLEDVLCRILIHCSKQDVMDAWISVQAAQTERSGQELF